MRILHSSDWHLGNRLMEQSRQSEFAAFLNWLLTTMERERVEALLVSGDIFDSTTPGDQARELYCDFLSRADATGCRHIIITGGNHDSVQMLRVAAPLLARHHACVIPSLRVENAADCLIPLLNATGEEEALVAAVPFLRPAEVSRRVAAEDAEARRSAYVDGVADCYAAVAEAVKAWQAEKAERAALPVIAMGHLSVGGATATGSTRPAVIGTVDAVSSSIFDPVFNYVALGHIHKPASLKGGRVRYCGSPLPMGFDEAALPQEMLLLEVSPGSVEARPLPVPRFALYAEENCSTALEVTAMLARLKQEAEEAGSEGSPLPVWLKLYYSGADKSPRELNSELAAAAAEHHLKSYRAMRPMQLPTTAPQEAGSAPAERLTLQDMEPHQLFARRLSEWSEALDSPLSAEDSELLTALFTSIVDEVKAETNQNKA